MANRYTPWPEEDDALILRHYKGDKTAAQIGLMCNPKRSKNSVISRQQTLMGIRRLRGYVPKKERTPAAPKEFVTRPTPGMPKLSFLGEARPAYPWDAAD